MKKFYDHEQMVEDVRKAIERELANHRVEPFSALAIGTVLEAWASPFKWAYSAGPLLEPVAEPALRAFQHSRIAFRVAAAQSPHSLIVNPLMVAAAVAALRSKRPLTFEELRRNAFRVHLKAPTMNVTGVAKAIDRDKSLEPAFDSALNYLEETGVLERTGNQGKWRLGKQFE